MAGSFKFAFSIDGDASKAIKAMENLAKSMDRLAKALENFGKSSERAGKRSEGAARKADAAWKKASKTVQTAMTTVNQVSSTPVPAAGGAGGGGGVPPTVPFTGGVSGPFPEFPDPNIIDGAFRVLRDPPDLRRMMSDLGSISRLFVRVGSTAMSAGRSIMDSFGNRTVGMFNAIGKHVEKLRYNFANVVDAMRLTGQAVTNVGRALFFFVTIPIGGFLMATAKAAIDFDDAMIRVRKTTGLTGQQLGVLSQNLRNMAKVMASSHIELAGIAEIIGQFYYSTYETVCNVGCYN